MGRAFVASALWSLVACGGGGGGDVDAGPGCTDELCSDGVYCNGLERCEPEATSADTRGCVRGTPPCFAGQTCEEATSRCQTVCETTVDADGDGVPAIECGGNDCDDADAERYPGAVEICDSDDEDCDASSLGTTDLDGDGFVDARCCNGALCGDDCDDSDASRRPGANEVCNESDEDCDGSVDEGVLRRFHRDADADGFGGSVEARLACLPEDGWVENALDCDDDDRSVSPARTEICNGVDDDCDRDVDESSVAASCAARFGSPPRTFFGCVDDACAITSCAEGHANCNGELSDGCEVDLREDPTHCGACGRGCGVAGRCESGSCDPWVSVAAGSTHTCALRAGGRVVCWGSNDFGQLGDRSTADRLTPVVVAELEGASHVAVSREPRPVSFRGDEVPFSCARVGALVACWGGADFGQLGDGNEASVALTPRVLASLPARDPRPTGRVVGALGDVLSLGASHACVEQSFAGTSSPPSITSAWCWGHNDAREIASSGAFFASPTQALGDADPSAVTRRGVVAAGHDHTCLLYEVCTDDCASVTRRLSCRGANASFALGTGSVGATSHTMSADAYTDVGAGNGFTCALRSDGGVDCWGLGTSGQLGDGARTSRSSPTRVEGISDATALSVGSSHACAVRAGGTVMCWGSNGQRQSSGVSGTTDLATEVVGVAGVVSISAGAEHTCAIVDDGEAISCWGSNAFGQLGDGTRLPSRGGRAPALVTDT